MIELMVRVAAASLFFTGCSDPLREQVPPVAEDSVVMRKMKPVIDGDWWVIAPSPDLSAVLPELNEEPGREREPNDHHIFQSKDGVWQLWACVRKTEVGRCLVNWEAGSLKESPWLLTGRVIRASREAGESRVEWKGQEFLQSPYVVKAGGRYWMFYGGYASGSDPRGKPTRSYASMENQIGLMVSEDGTHWQRHKDRDGQSRVCLGPGAARDPMVVRFDGTWHLYYTGHLEENLQKEAIVVRTSDDLVHWSDWKVAHFIDAPYRSSRTNESPFVTYRNGYYYLFRSGGYKGGKGSGSVAVFRSTSPVDFGTSGDGKEHYVCNIDAHACEIITDEEGRELISKIHSPETGYAIHLARLKWVPEE